MYDVHVTLSRRSRIFRCIVAGITAICLLPFMYCGAYVFVGFLAGDGIISASVHGHLCDTVFDPISADDGWLENAMITGYMAGVEITR